MASSTAGVMTSATTAGAPEALGPSATAATHDAHLADAALQAAGLGPGTGSTSPKLPPQIMHPEEVKFEHAKGRGDDISPGSSPSWKRGGSSTTLLAEMALFLERHPSFASNLNAIVPLSPGSSNSLVWQMGAPRPGSHPHRPQRKSGIEVFPDAEETSSGAGRE